MNIIRAWILLSLAAVALIPSGGAFVGRDGLFPGSISEWLNRAHEPLEMIFFDGMQFRSRPVEIQELEGALAQTSLFRGSLQGSGGAHVHDVGFGSSVMKALNDASGWPYCDHSSSWVWQYTKTDQLPGLIAGPVPSAPLISPPVCGGYFGKPLLFTGLKLHSAGAEAWGASSVSWWIRDGHQPGGGHPRGLHVGDYDEALHSGVGVFFVLRLPPGGNDFVYEAFLGGSASTKLTSSVSP